MPTDKETPILNDLEEVLARGLQDHYGRPVRILEVHSRFLDTHSTHLLSRLHLTLDFGERLTVILKELQPQPDRDVRQTVLKYERLLADRRLDGPKVYASVCDEVRRRYWIFLEDVGEWKLHYCEMGAWLAAFRWLARMHATYYGREEELRALGSLNIHGPVFYRFLARSARQVLQTYAERRQIARFERVMRRWFGASVAHLASQPRTLVHGDAYDKNFMVQPGPRIRPIDWEYAAIGVAASDVAQLVAGWGPEKPYFITVYLEEFTRFAAVPLGRRAFERTLNYCEIMRILQVLYWWEGPYEDLGVIDELLDELESACYQLQSEGGDL